MSERSAPVLVLLYHRVAPPHDDVHELAVHPDRFAAQIDHLRRSEVVVPLADARESGGRRRVVVTFDDGYADNVAAATDVLAAAGAPATFFVSAGLVDSTTPLWWDELTHLFFTGAPRQRHVALDIAGARLLLDVGSAPARTRCHWAVYHRLRPRRREAIDAVLDQLRAQIDAPPMAPAPFMTSEQLRALTAVPGAEIGGHSVTHQQLSSLSRDEQWQEIAGCRDALAGLIGRPVRTFAYPFGGTDAFDDTSAALAADAGFDVACAGYPGLTGTATDPYRIPRVCVRDWDAPELAARLDDWFRHLPS